MYKTTHAWQSSPKTCYACNAEILVFELQVIYCSIMYYISQMEHSNNTRTMKNDLK